MTTVDSARDSDERQVRLTERAALANVGTVLELCAAGALRCSEKTSRPTAATVRTVDAHLVHGDFYADEPIAAIAWPLLVQSRRSGQTGRHAAATGLERPCGTWRTTCRGRPQPVAAMATAALIAPDRPQ